MGISILYEDEKVLAVDKPVGVAVHGDGYSDAYTIADWVLEKYPALAEVGESLTMSSGAVIEKPGIVHRLDKDTSGVLLIAKDQLTYWSLKKQFKDHTISKVYRALVYGNFGLDKREGTIDLPIGRSRKDSRKRLAGRGASSILRPAITDYQVISGYNGYSYLEARPRTGRTHQIRVHLKAINHPIVCDSLYATGQPCLPPLDRQALHAFSLEFELSGKRVHLESPLPADFQAALDNLKSL